MSLRLFLMDQLKVTDMSMIEAMENIFKTIEESAAFIHEPVTQNSRTEWFCCAYFLYIRQNERHGQMNTTTDCSTKGEDFYLLKCIVSKLSYISFVEKLKKLCAELYGSSTGSQDYYEMLMRDIKEMGGGYCVSIAMYKKYIQSWNHFMSPNSHNKKRREENSETAAANHVHQLKQEIGWFVYLFAKCSEGIIGSNITQSYYLMISAIVYLIHQNKMSVNSSLSSMSLIKMEDPTIANTNYLSLIKEVCQFNGLSSPSQFNDIENYVHIIEHIMVKFINSHWDKTVAKNNNIDMISQHHTIEFLLESKTEFELYVCHQIQTTQHPFQFDETTLMNDDYSTHNVSKGPAASGAVCYDKNLSRELGLEMEVPGLHTVSRSQTPSNTFFTAAMESSMLLHLLNHMKHSHTFSSLSSLLSPLKTSQGISSPSVGVVDNRLVSLRLHISTMQIKLKDCLLDLGSESFVQTVMSQMESLYVYSLSELLQGSPVVEQLLTTFTLSSSLFAVATEIVLKAHSLVVISFPQILQILHIRAYDFNHILVYYIEKINILPGSMQQHLERVHETILKTQVWKEDSDIFNEPNSKMIDQGTESVNIDIFLNNEKLNHKFFENVQKFNNELISMLTLSFANILVLNGSVNDQIVRNNVNGLMQICVNKHIHMFKNRNLVHIILCSFYAICKINGISISFNEIIQKYMELFRCPITFFEHIPLTKFEQPLGDLISFFNHVYLIEMKSELTKLHANPMPEKKSNDSNTAQTACEEVEQRSFISSRLGTSKFRVSIHHSPIQIKTGRGSTALRVPYMRRMLPFTTNTHRKSIDTDTTNSSSLCYQNNTRKSGVDTEESSDDDGYHSPKHSTMSSGLVNAVYSFGKSPSKDLCSINNVLKRRKS